MSPLTRCKLALMRSKKTTEYCHTEWIERIYQSLKLLDVRRLYIILLTNCVSSVSFCCLCCSATVERPSFLILVQLGTGSGGTITTVPEVTIETDHYHSPPAMRCLIYSITLQLHELMKLDQTSPHLIRTL